MSQMGFFDIANRYAGLDAKNGPLVKIDEVVPWEDFRPRLEAAWRKAAGERKSPAGRKPWDAVVMLKTIVLCALYNLSDDQVYYLIEEMMKRDEVGEFRLRFLGMRDGVPDIVLSLDFSTPAAYDEFVLGQRRSLKEERDKAILRAALENYAMAHNDGPPSSAEDLEKFLGDEAELLFARYDVGDRSLPTRGGELPAAIFNGPNYREQGASDISYLSPSIGDNDLRYRFTENERGATDIESMRRNRFRLAIREDPDKATLVVGTDAGALSSLAAQPPARSREDAVKLIAQGNPEWIIDQAQLYPNDDVREAVRSEGWMLLDQYRRFNLTISPTRNVHGLVLFVEFQHEPD